MRKFNLLLCVTLLVIGQVLAQAVKPKKLATITGHYAALAKLPKSDVDSERDTIKFPLVEFRRLPYLKLRTNYLADLPTSLNYPKPPANSSEQTKAELTYLLELQKNRTTADTSRYMMLANVYHDPYTFNPTDPDYDRNFSSLFFVGKPIGEWFTYKNCPKTVLLLSKVIQDATYYVFWFKYDFNRPRPYHLEPKLQNLQRLGHASYPSGHSSFSWVNAYVVEELAPNLKEQFYKNATELAFSREVIGVHYPSDSEAGRVWARDFVNRLFKNPSFINDLEAAKKEVFTFTQKLNEH